MSSRAAAIIIGNEILSGRTRDTNTQLIASMLGDIGITLVEVRIVGDIEGAIIDNVRTLSAKYDYVFTTGGIGPTHDDITAQSIAKAFDLEYSLNQEIYVIIKKNYGNTDINDARKKMAYIPYGAQLLYNDATFIPGFVTRNVFSLAGVPEIMKSMLSAVIPTLKHGRVIKSKTIKLMHAESRIAHILTLSQQQHTNVEIGSYPFTENNVRGTEIVLRSSDYDALKLVYQSLRKDISNATEQ